MNKLDVAVKTGPGKYSFTGYIVEHGDTKGLEGAKDWAREREWDYEKKEYTEVYEPKVYTFDNEGFSATILDSAGGSSQGGRLSFWRCEIEKDGVKFTIGVNDAILADLIKNSDISNGVVKQKVMFARKGGQPGLIHDKMDAYADAKADMQQKADLKSAKKTNKWEIGGAYSTLTHTDICIGEVYDTLEEYEVEETYNGWRYGSTRKVTKLREAANPNKITAWMSLYNYRGETVVPNSLGDFLRDKLKDNYYYLSTGKPPARAKASQLKVKISDQILIDELLAKHEEYTGYGSPNRKGRYVRILK